MPSRDDLNVILHIGGAKCGSSAIQAFLAQNAAALGERAVGVPGQSLTFDAPVTGEQIWFLEDSAAADRHDLIGERMQSLCVEARARGLSTVILSAENMCNHPSLAATMAAALGETPCRIVFYVRRQDDFLISSWQQWNLKRFDRVEEFLAAKVGRDACWFSMIEPWAAAFSDERVSVRPFQRDRLTGGDVIADFFDVIGVGTDGLLPLSKNANPSFDEALARLAHRVRDVFDGPHDNQFYDVMVRLIGDRALKRGSASSLLDLETRHLILAGYEQQNTALKERFLPDLGEAPLFPPPAPESVREMTEEAKMAEDIAMLTRAVYALAAKAERGEG